MPPRELVSEEGLRLDGRQPSDLRRWKGKINVVKTADGSAYLAQGSTQVIVSIMGPKEGTTETSKSSYMKPKVSVNIIWNTATFSDTEQRSRPRFGKDARDTKSPIQDRKITSFIAILKDCLENTIIATTLPNAHLDVHVNILSSDGSILSCAMNAISLALMDAGLPMLDIISAVSVGLAILPSSVDAVTGKTRRVHEMLTRGYVSIVDVSGQEEFIPVLTCAFLPNHNGMAFSHLEAKVPVSELTAMTEVAEQASLEVQKRLKEIVIGHYAS